jgi:hypothetical protein
MKAIARKDRVRLLRNSVGFGWRTRGGGRDPGQA